MYKHLFSSLIKCKNCGYNYKFITDRKIPKYICSGYSRQLLDGCKIRYAVKEEELIYLVQIFCNRNNMQLEYTNSFMRKIINKIYIDKEEDGIEIYYKNGEKSIYSKKDIHI